LIDWFMLPEVAVTIRLYVPVGVPFGLGFGPPPLATLLLPPHEHWKHNKSADGNKKVRLIDF
jgi:hypothetical protein